MRHGNAHRKLNRTAEHRKAMFANMCAALIKHEQIITTLPKAKDLKRVIDKYITLAKRGDLNSRRLCAARLGDEDMTKKLFDVLAQRYKSRSGGYARVVKAGFRYGDMAPRAVIEFIDRDQAATVFGDLLVQQRAEEGGGEQTHHGSRRDGKDRRAFGHPEIVPFVTFISDDAVLFSPVGDLAPVVEERLRNIVVREVGEVVVGARGERPGEKRNIGRVDDFDGCVAGLAIDRRADGGVPWRKRGDLSGLRHGRDACRGSGPGECLATDGGALSILRSRRQ